MASLKLRASCLLRARFSTLLSRQSFRRIARCRSDALRGVSQSRAARRWGSLWSLGRVHPVAQIADELNRAGRKVFLSVGPHDRPPRRYRDVISSGGLAYWVFGICACTKAWADQTHSLSCGEWSAARWISAALEEKA